MKTRSILGNDLPLLYIAARNVEMSSENQKKKIFSKDHHQGKAFIAMTMPDWVLISVQA